MNKVKVAFYSPPGGTANYSALSAEQIFVNPTPYYLHGYFRINYPEYAEQVTWIPSILYTVPSSELIKYIEDNNANVLCVSIYIWNIRSIWTLVKDVRQYFGDKITIVVGGPSTDAVKQDWHSTYPFVDHWVVGQGEKAWANLVLDFIGVKSVTTDEANIVHFVKNIEDAKTSKKIYNYEFIRGIHFSPYIVCEDMVIEFIEFYKNKKYDISWVYETSRGCPYHCTFCDWNGGQTNKTQKRKINFLDDIDFMAKHGMYNLYLADANFGMWEDDLVITKRIIEHNEQGHHFKYVLYNLNKILNSWTKEIFELIIKNKLSKFWIKISAQDINADVLEAIDRPGNWTEAKNLALSMYEKYNESHGLNKIYVEIIVGLPGQSLVSFNETLDEVYSSGFIPRSYPFQVLPNAPIGYDEEYRKKYQVASGEVFDVIDFKIIDVSIEDLHKQRNPNIISEMILSTSTASEEDMACMFVIDNLYRTLFANYNLPNWNLVNTNWIHLKKLVTVLMETDDFKKIVDIRTKNFLKYRINALNDSNGKILTKGTDMKSLISRNWKLIELTMKDCVDKDKFLKVWRDDYHRAPDLLPWPAATIGIGNQL